MIQSSDRQLYDIVVRSLIKLNSKFRTFKIQNELKKIISKLRRLYVKQERKLASASQSLKGS